MANTFSHEFSIPGAPADAKARVRDAVSDRLTRQAGMQLSAQTDASLVYTPRLKFPVFLWLYRRLSGERVNLTFAAQGSQTHVSVSGKVGSSAQAAARREFWSEALSVE